MGQQRRCRVRSAADGARCHRGQRPNGAAACGDEGLSRRIPSGDPAAIPDDAQRGGRPELHLVRGTLDHQTAARREGPQRVHGRRRGRAQPEPDNGGGSGRRLHLRAGIRRRRRGRRYADLPARRRAHRGRRTRLRVPAGAGGERPARQHQHGRQDATRGHHRQEARDGRGDARQARAGRNVLRRHRRDRRQSRRDQRR